MSVTFAPAKLAVQHRSLPGWRSLVPLLPFLPIAGAGVALLVMLETNWIPNSMPREYVTRQALVVTLPSADLAAEQIDALTLRVQDPGLLAAAVGTLDRTPTGEPLQGSVRATSQCVEAFGDEGRLRRGLLVIVTVRGSDEERLGITARAWTAAFLASLAKGDYLVRTRGDSQAAYSLCSDHR